MKKSRRGVLTVFGAAVASVAMAGGAFACIAFTGEGKVTVPGNGTSSTAIGDEQTYHGFCSLATGARAASGAAVTVAVAGHVNSGPGDPCPTNKLPPSDKWLLGANGLQNDGMGPYNVSFRNVGFGKTQGSWGLSKFACNDEEANTTIGTLHVDDNGSGSWSGKLPTATVSAPSEQAAICVWGKRESRLETAYLGGAVDQANPLYRSPDFKAIQIPVEIVVI